ncbi:MAG: O-methyltransferase [Flavobacteriales bacterium]
MESLNPAIETYAQHLSSPEPEVLQELSRETQEKVEKPQMLSGHLQGRILSMLSHMIRPRQVLDIGTYTGYSAICLAEGLQVNGIVRTVDKNEELREMAERYFQRSGLSSHITYHSGNALELIDEWEAPFDLVFIDADKENYHRYYDQVFERVPSGGYIIADNVLWKRKVLESEQEKDAITQSLQAYNEKVRNDDRVENLILPVRDGLSIARKL